jgi:hypothetical protein
LTARSAVGKNGVCEEGAIAHEQVDGVYPLDRVDAAMADAADRCVLRAAIVP